MASEIPDPPDGVPQCEQRVTPGLIVSILPKARLTEVARQLELPVPSLAARESQMHDHMAQRMLAELTVDELRRIAVLVGAPADGQFVDLYRRLARLC